jgi:hypothetical protein
MVVIAACAPVPGLENHPPPCLTGYHLCGSSGYCIEETDGSMGGDTDGGGSLLVGGCLAAYEVRQYSEVLIPVPFGGVDDVSTEIVSPSSTLGVGTSSSSVDVTATPKVVDGKVWIAVHADHGAALGGRDVYIRTKGAPESATRKVEVDVSPIAVVPKCAAHPPAGTPACSGGDDDNLGQIGSPFATLAKALSVATGDDTIQIGNGPNGATGPDNDQSGIGPLVKTVTFPDGLTIKGTDTGGTQLYMPIVLQGGAIMENMYLRNYRLVVTKPGSTLELDQSLVGPGVTIAASAGSISPNDEPTIFRMYGGELRNDAPPSSPGTDSSQVPTLSPLLVSAVGANVTIANDASISRNGSADPTVSGVLFEGGSQTLDIEGSGTAIVVHYSGAAPAVRLAGQTTLTVHNAIFEGRFEIADPSSTADIEGATFNLSDSMGSIVFGGSALTVRASTFTGGLAIVQNNPLSRVTLRNSKITGYTQVGYRLIAGFLDAGTVADPGSNTFADFFYPGSSPSLGATEPSAFSVEVLDPPPDGVVATSSASMFNGMQPGTCTASKTENLTMDMPGIVTITTPAYPIEVNFY